jgi:hypothetical protein
MRKTTIRCGCGAKINTLEYDDDKDDIEMTGMCARCSELGKFYVDPEDERKRNDHVALSRSQKGTKPLRKKRS